MLQHVNLENSILSLNNQSQKTIYCVIIFIWNAQKRKIYGDKKQIISRLPNHYPFSLATLVTVHLWESTNNCIFFPYSYFITHCLLCSQIFLPFMLLFLWNCQSQHEFIKLDRFSFTIPSQSVHSDLSNHNISFIILQRTI